MPPGLWVASTKPEAALGRAKVLEPWGGGGWALALRDRGPEAGMYCWAGHLSLARRGCLAGEDLRQPIDVDLAERALPRSDLLLEPGDELGAQDVDLPVQEPAPVRDFLLFALEIVDQFLQIGVGERGEIGQGFQVSLSFGGSVNQADG